MRINWTQDKIDFIIKQYTSKQMNTNELARYFGCSNDTISRRLKENGIVPHKFFEDLTGKKYGKLLVLGKSSKSGRRIYWECQCECGKIITVKGDTLRQGLQSSCGCNRSKGENIISELLLNNHIKFIPQYYFDDFRSDYNNIPYKFDFAVIKNNSIFYLIEYDGEQHFEDKITNNGWNTREKFYKTQERDDKKNDYCYKNNIPLIRIPYWKKESLTINDLLLETTNFLFLKGEK